MIRKQLYISDEHERALKARAGELGVSEAELVRREVEHLLLAFPVLPLTGPVVLEALRGVQEHLLSYYDAQVWAVARLGQVGVVLSEDFNPGAVLDGVSFANPLEPAFDFAALD
jgi:predicted nucleic acid-binding protein